MLQMGDRLSRQSDGAQGLPPVILLGGGANALSLARSFGRQGIAVHVINYPGEWVRYSRFVNTVCFPANDDPEESWARYLEGPDSEHLRGAVLLPCSAVAIEVLAGHRDVLAAKFRIDVRNWPAQLCMLNK